MKAARVLSLLFALLLLLHPALAETAGDQVVATVNGEPLSADVYARYESQYYQAYASYGLDLADDKLLGYVQDAALTAAIQDMLLEQDMRAQGCCDFDEATQAWLTEQGTAAYQAALADVEAVLRAELGLSPDEDVSRAALLYAANLNVSEQSYIDLFRTQYAQANYYAWLTRDMPVTDEDIEEVYAQRVADSTAKYAGNPAGFETDLYNDAEVWYKPEGYRSILQILLPAQGDNDADRLASVQATLDEIEQRLANGEAFQELIAVYGTDSALQSEAFMQTGYQVHRDSVLWDEAFVAAAFSEEMAQPGCHSKPLVSSQGVHLLYYLCDSPSGPIELTPDIRTALGYTIYNERCQAALAERLNLLSDQAVVVFP